MGSNDKREFILSTITAGFLILIEKVVKANGCKCMSKATFDKMCSRVWLEYEMKYQPPERPCKIPSK